MGMVDLPQIQARGDKSLDEYVRYLADMVAILQQELLNVLEGRIDSRNMREIAGFNVSLTELKHKSGIVGMNGADPADDEAVRIWAGDADKENAPFIVRQNGVMEAIGSFLRTIDSGYPAVEINSDDNLLAAYASNTNYISITPSNLGNPALILSNTEEAIINNDGADLLIRTAIGGGLGIQVSCDDDLRLSSQNNVRITGTNLIINGVTGYNGSFSYVKNVVAGAPTFGILTFTKGILTSMT